MANTVAAGSVFQILGYDIEALLGYLKTQFGKKDPGETARNIACARRGAQLTEQLAITLQGPPPTAAPRSLMSGADAVGLGACAAGVKFVAAYPMTPATATFNYFAAHGDEYGIVVEQAEDEIAAVNMICGATYAGIPAMATTSGGGFALMNEGLSLGGIMELPIVILLAQRPGPATGLPTRTAQQDLKYALYAGHGEFARAIYAPGTVEQCYALTHRALQVAHRYQTPAIVLTDQFLQDMLQNVPPFPQGPDFIDRCIVRDVASDYRRYEVTESGVSPRAIPGEGGFVVCDSDEHTAEGHITEDLKARIAQQNKRMRKLEGMSSEALAPDLYGREDPETLLIAWGSTYGPVRETVDAINTDGDSAAMLHFSQLWPLKLSAETDTIAKAKRVVSVEANQTGQFASILREAGLVGNIELLTRYDGLPFTAQYILENLVA